MGRAGLTIGPNTTIWGPRVLRCALFPLLPGIYPSSHRNTLPSGEWGAIAAGICL